MTHYLCSTFHKMQLEVHDSSEYINVVVVVMIGVFLSVSLCVLVWCETDLHSCRNRQMTTLRSVWVVQCFAVMGVSLCHTHIHLISFGSQFFLRLKHCLSEERPSLAPLPLFFYGCHSNRTVLSWGMLAGFFCRRQQEGTARLTSERQGAAAAGNARNHASDPNRLTDADASRHRK